MKKIEITEEDIFNFALYPEELSPEKKEYISEKYSEYKEHIELCRSLRNAPDNINIEELRNKILLTGNNKEIELLPINNLEYEEPKYSLAAASPVTEKEIRAVSFSDKNSSYIVRVINSIEKSLIYVFASDGINEMKLTLHPSQEEITVNDFSEPIERLSKEKIDRIVVSEVK